MTHPALEALDNNYFAKVILTLIGSLGLVAGVAGGYYTLFMLVTLAGN